MTEAIEIRTRDGHALRAELTEPHQRRIVGTAVLSHPMFANKAVFARPRGRGLADLFVDAGWRTLSFDFRGHGESLPRAPQEKPWGYDDLVSIDLPTVVGAARGRWPRSAVAVVGHSLGGHVALASQGAGLIEADALVVAAGNVWMRQLEPSRRIWAMKLATITAMAAVARRQGYFPVRALRLGSDDEATPYVGDLARFARTGRWTSTDGQTDYAAGLAGIRVPTFALTSSGDHFYCRTECAHRMMAGISSCTHHVMTGSLAPGHMGIVTDESARGSWRRALQWLSEVLPRRTASPVLISSGA